MIKTLKYLGDPILRKKCKKVEEVTPEILQIAGELIETMAAHNGVGLAAPQIGYDVRMFAICISDEIDEKGNPLEVEPTVFLNPVITQSSKKKISLSEGCLSIPGFYENVERPEKISFEALTLDGKTQMEKHLSNWRSRCIQHELDHLDGVLFIDHFPEALKKQHENALHMIEMRFKQPLLHKGDPFQKA